MDKCTKSPDGKHIWKERNWTIKCSACQKVVFIHDVIKDWQARGERIEGMRAVLKRAYKYMDINAPEREDTETWALMSEIDKALQEEGEGAADEEEKTTPE